MLLKGWWSNYWGTYWDANYWPYNPTIISVIPDVHQPGIGPRGIGKSRPHTDRITQYVKHPMRNINYIRKSR